jgi:hypothetical protein
MGIDPNNALVWDDKVWTLHKLGKHTEAKKWKVMKQESNTRKNDERRIKWYT